MYLFQPHDLIYIGAFFLSVMHFHAPTRQMMMLIKFVCCSLCAYYFHLLGMETAMYAGIIAGLGGLLQACFSDAMLQKTRILRSLLAVMLALAAIIVTGGFGGESLPLVAVIIARLSEAQGAQQRIRMGYVLSQLCWIMFAFEQGLMLVLVTENLNLLSNLIAIWRGEQARKRILCLKNMPFRTITVRAS